MKILESNRILPSFILLILLIFSNIEKSSAKNNDTIFVNNIQVELRTSYGFILCHHTEMNYFRAHFPAFELSVQQATFGRKYWQSRLNYPAIGFTLFYSELGGMPEIGRAFALYPHISFNFLKSKKNQLNLKLGVGVSYVTEKYEAKTNPKNTFVGSNFNAALAASFEYNRMITNRLSLSLFAGLTHFSNGATRAPNNGLNIAHGGISAKYFISEPQAKIPKQHTDNQRFKKWSKENLSLYTAITYSKKDIDEFMGYGMSWSVYHFQINALKRCGEISKLGLGFDLVYDQTDIDVLKHQGIDCEPVEILKPGINAAYELIMGSTSFIFNFGFHISGKEMGEGRLYQKIGIMQSIGNRFFATAVLNLHFGWADYIGFGLGYRILK